MTSDPLLTSESAPRWDDVPTALLTARPMAVLVELPGAVLDFTGPDQWGFGEGPIGRAGTAVLETLACAASRLDHDAEFDAIMTSAIAAGIFAGDLDHEWNDDDPDGHYDNSWLAAKYRADGFVLDLMQGVRPHADAISAGRMLPSLQVRPVAIPFLGVDRTHAMLGPDLDKIFEFVDVEPAPSLTSLLASMAAELDLPQNAVSAITGTRAMAEAAMAAGLGTIWIDRAVRARGSDYDARTRARRTYRWGGAPPVPVIVDDFAAAAQCLTEVDGG